MIQTNLTNNQLLMWLGQKQHPNKPLYNMIQTSTIHGEIDVERFKQAFDDVVMQMDTLRLIIEEDNGLPVQRVADSVPQALEILQLDDTAYENWLLQRRSMMLDIAQCTYDSALIELPDNRYVWYYNQHHIATDATSFELIYKRLMALYQGEALDPAPQYMAYVAYEQAHRQTETFAKAQQYWQDKISNDYESLKFYGQPDDKQSTAVTRTVCKLSDAQLEKINLLIQQKGIRTFSENLTRFSVLFAIYASYIKRVTQQSEFLVGVPFRNRVSAEHNDIAGLFIEIGVLSVKIDSETTFTDLIRVTTKQMLQAMQHVQSGISTAQMNRAYDVVFNYAPVNFSNFAGMPVDTLWHQSGDNDSIHSIHTQVYDFDGSGREVFQFDLSQSIFTENLIQTVLQHFSTLTTSLLNNPDSPIVQAQLLTSAEYQKIVVDWNDTDADYGESVPVHRLFEQQAEKRPNHPALITEHGQMTYAEVNKRANQLAHYLMAQGVGAETLIAVATERSFEMIISLLGILKAGGAYVPVDPTYPAERVQFMLEDTQAPFVLALSQSSIATSGISQILYLDTMVDELSQQASNNPEAELTVDNLAYVIYTSGSTGNPKGVMITHQNLSNLLHYMNDTFEYTPEDGILQKTSISFDVSMSEIFTPLIYGATLYLAHPNVPRDVDKMYKALSDFPITHLAVVPTQLTLLLRDYDFSVCKRLKHIVSAGEPLSPELLRDTLKTLPDVIVDNIYGPTEFTVYATHWSTTVPADPVLIGKPLSNTQIYVLDNNLQVLPIGMAGELYLGGVQVARGYFNRPELTQECFIDHPEFGRLYRTGDLVRWVQDGNIEMFGRTDFQVKINGARVEPGEVENQILTYEGVDAVVVMARASSEGVMQLIAYIVGDIDHNLLRQNLLEVLPVNMIPSIFVSLDSIPLAPNGKVNRSALKQIDLTEYRNANEYTSPRTDTEVVIADIWQESFARERIGIHDDFFALGGDSLLALRIYSRIESTYNISLPINELFNNPTIQQLALYLENVLVSEIDSLSDEEVLRLLKEEEADE